MQLPLRKAFVHSGTCGGFIGNLVAGRLADLSVRATLVGVLLALILTLAVFPLLAPRPAPMIGAVLILGMLSTATIAPLRSGPLSADWASLRGCCAGADSGARSWRRPVWAWQLPPSAWIARPARAGRTITRRRSRS